jgi:hypothetical protein
MKTSQFFASNSFTSVGAAEQRDRKRETDLLLFWSVPPTITEREEQLEGKIRSATALPRTRPCLDATAVAAKYPALLSLWSLSF